MAGCLALLWALGCRGRVTVCEVITNGGTVAAGAEAGTPSSSGGAGVSMAGAPNEGGVGAVGIAGDIGVAGDVGIAGAPAGGIGGAVGAEGGAGASAGGIGNEAGANHEGGAPCGTPIPDVPADCHDTLACDPSARIVDQNNVPVPANPCLVGTCNVAGLPGTAAAAEGSACKAAGGGKLCDGAGKCVPCLHESDCPGGQVCSDTHHCVTASCTDVDCGGACPPCGVGKKCLADQDCSSFACDAATLTCITPQCQDHRQDGVETDADCGGDACPPCALGKGCLIDDDCASQACDAIQQICMGNQCSDHRVDGNESDVDCGGGICGWCQVGQKCTNTGDCASGHVCLGVKKVCQ